MLHKCKQSLGRIPNLFMNLMFIITRSDRFLLSCGNGGLLIAEAGASLSDQAGAIMDCLNSTK